MICTMLYDLLDRSEKRTGTQKEIKIDQWGLIKAPGMGVIFICNHNGYGTMYFLNSFKHPIIVQYGVRVIYDG